MMSSTEKSSAKQMEARARRLVTEQRKARGYSKGDPVMIEGEKRETLRINPYKQTPETEARAAEILRLRRAAARSG